MSSLDSQRQRDHNYTVATKTNGRLKNPAIDLSRYVRHKLGRTTEEIAAQDGVKVLLVEKSIANIDAYRATHTAEYLNQAMIGAVMENKREIQAALRRGLTATTENKKGRKVQDVKTQLAAVDRATKIVETVQPKPTKGISVGVNVNQQTATIAPGTPPPESNFTGYEERLRKIRARVDQHNQLPSRTGTVNDDDADIVEEDPEEGVTADVGSGPQG